MNYVVICSGIHGSVIFYFKNFKDMWIIKVENKKLRLSKAKK